MIAFRRKHRLAPKLRSDYYERTLDKARRPIEHARTVREALDRVTSSETDGDGNAAGAQNKDEDGNQTVEDEEERRARILEALSAVFDKIIVAKVERFRSRSTTYVMTTDRGPVYLNSTKDILVQSRFTERVADGTQSGSESTRSERPGGPTVAQLILDACVDRDMGELASPESELAAWVDMYLLDRGVLEDKHDAAAEQAPLLYESRMHIHLYDFRRWLHTQLGITISPKDLVQTLTKAGWGYERLNVVVGGHRTTYRTWRCGEDYQREND